MAKTTKNSPKVLGLDVSTKTIGWALFDIQSKDLLELTHISPIVKEKTEEKFPKQELFPGEILQYNVDALRKLDET